MKKNIFVFTAVTSLLLVASFVLFTPKARNSNIENTQPAHTTAQPTPAATPKKTRQPTVTPSAKPGTKAEQILSQVLSQRQMSDDEARTYNNTPDHIKEMTYEEARAREAELEEYIWGSGRSYLEIDLNLVDEHSYVRDYAKVIATGNDWIEIQLTKWRANAEQLLAEAELYDDKLYGDNIDERDQARIDYRNAVCNFIITAVDKLLPLPANAADNLDFYAHFLEFVDMNFSAFTDNFYTALRANQLIDYTNQIKAGAPIAEIIGYTAAE